MFKTNKVRKAPIIRMEYDANAYMGVDKSDNLSIHLALQNGEKLSVDRAGHVYNSNGRWIADCMRRV